jgi:hypothetical protein
MKRFPMISHRYWREDYLKVRLCLDSLTSGCGEYVGNGSLAMSELSTTPLPEALYSELRGGF